MSISFIIWIRGEDKAIISFNKDALDLVRGIMLPYMYGVSYTFDIKG